MSKELHVHDYQRGEEKIIADNPKYTGGRLVTLINLICECGDSKTIDMRIEETEAS